ncbi:hypothetical protein HPGCJGGD_3716 [Methylobacterium haplocladii]|nr:hypothetical protein HPGCJGGD_3716 [Methylobacterium haplocladii]
MQEGRWDKSEETVNNLRGAVDKPGDGAWQASRARTRRTKKPGAKAGLFSSVVPGKASQAARAFTRAARRETFRDALFL